MRFRTELGGVERVSARPVIAAVGVQASAYVPEPTSLCTLSSAHQELPAFRVKEVIAVSAGQSALESPALLHENGVAVKPLTMDVLRRLPEKHQAAPARSQSARVTGQ